MAKRKRKNNAKKGSSTKKGSRLRNAFRSFAAFLRNKKTHRVTGLFFVLFSVALFFAFTSYLFTWSTDQELGGKEAANWIGKAGRTISIQLIRNGFGVGAYFLVLLSFIYGFRLLAGRSLLPLWKTTRVSILMMVWISVTLGFLLDLFHANPEMGGAFGLYITTKLNAYIAPLGTALLLLFIALSWIIYTFNPSFNFSFLNDWFRKKNKTVAKKESKASPREDIYNTREYAVEDDTADEPAISGAGSDDPEKEEDEDRLFGGGKEHPEDDEELPGRPGPIILDPEVPAADENKTTADEIEMTVETGADDAPLPEEENGTVASTEHKTLDEPYDPTLDLPDYRRPGLDLLEEYGSNEITVREEELEQNKVRIVETLKNYSIEIRKIKATIGPTVTLYEIVPAPGVRISKIKNLEDDIALSLAALGIRIIAPIPGKGTIGIEVPNSNPDIVSMKSVLASERFRKNKYELPFAIGKTISNETYVADLTRMPHILMAGATGQGKSVGLNAIITSLLYTKHPAELKLVMVDPKKVELTLYSKIERHFLAKLPDSEEAIITDTRKVVRTLNSLSIEMDNRYELLKDAQVRNIKEYNAKFKARKLSPLHGHRFLPYIVLVIDEFADLIMTAGKEIEVPITRLAQLARAVGIHLIIATQRPSVNIITGSIKANFPARIAFRVISKIDSRTILDTGGADQLIGRGDMLLSTGSDLIRLQCAFVDTPEIERITDFIGAQRAYPDAFHLPDYQDEESEKQTEYNPEERDELFEEAARIIVQTQQGSTSLLQRKLKLGYNRAGRIIDQLEAAGIVGPFEGSKAREVKIANEMALEQYLKDLDQKD
ncbi:MAG: DNA translocase FtsK [Bacteroidales bacterium]